MCVCVCVIIVSGTMRREDLSLATCWPAVRVPFQGLLSKQAQEQPHLLVCLPVCLNYTPNPTKVGSLILSPKISNIIDGI